MMVQAEPCSNMLAVQHIVLGLFNLLNTAFAAWLVHRRYLADKREFRRNGHEHGEKKRDR